MFGWREDGGRAWGGIEVVLHAFDAAGVLVLEVGDKAGASPKGTDRLIVSQLRGRLAVALCFFCLHVSVCFKLSSFILLDIHMYYYYDK